MSPDATGGWRPPEPWIGVDRFDEGRRHPRSRATRHATLRITRRYAAPAARVFAAWLDPAVAGQWLFATASHPLAHVAIDARTGGSFRFVDRDPAESTEYAGEYVDIVLPRRLVFTLRATKYPQTTTRVTVEIVALPKGCRLTVLHENVPREHAKAMEGRWTGVLYGLGATLDSASTFHDHDQE